MSPKQKKKKAAETSMVDKAKVKLEEQDESMGRRVVGMGFALVGFLLILGVIILNVLNNVEPTLDEDLNIPKLSELDEWTNKDRAVLEGEVEDVNQVIIYVNEKMLTETVEVEEDEFKFEYIYPDEGEYVFEAVSVAGFPFRKGSEKSNSVSTTVDWTAPSANIDLEYDSEVTTGLVTVVGKAEANITVRLLDGDEEVYSVETDDEGNFVIENIRLLAGENEFRIELEDRAGNKNILARRIEVSSLIDGPEVVDIPEASGDLFKAFGSVMNNNLMVVFGVLSLIALMGSSTVVWFRMKSE